MDRQHANFHLYDTQLLSFFTRCIRGAGWCSRGVYGGEVGHLRGIEVTCSELSVLYPSWTEMFRERSIGKALDDHLKLCIKALRVVSR